MDDSREEWQTEISGRGKTKRIAMEESTHWGSLDSLKKCEETGTVVFGKRVGKETEGGRIPLSVLGDGARGGDRLQEVRSSGVGKHSHS